MDFLGCEESPFTNRQLCNQYKIIQNLYSPILYAKRYASYVPTRISCSTSPSISNSTSSETLGVNLSGVEHTLNRLKVQLDSGFSKFQTWEVFRGRTMFISTSWPHVQTQGGSGCHLPSLGPKSEICQNLGAFLGKTFKVDFFTSSSQKIPSVSC